MSIRSISLLCFFILASLESAATAQNSDGDDLCRKNQECSQHHKVAIENFIEKKDYSKALVEFQRAYDAVPAPFLLINIGRCFFNLGRAEEAIQYYERFQREVPQPPAEAATRLPRFLAEARSVLSAQRAVTPSPKTPVPTATELPPQRRPLYKTWWPWTLGGVVLASIAVGIGVGVSQQPPPFYATDRSW